MQVGPTGIDSRHGLQDECIGCAACIDVCNDVMDKMDDPRGLIRYATESGVQPGWTRLQILKRALRPRVLVYGTVLASASLAFGASVALRSPFQVDLIKDRSSLGRSLGDGAVENVYRLQVMNRTEQAQAYRVRAGGLGGLAQSAADLQVPAAGIQSLVVSLRLPAVQAQALRGRSAPLWFEVTALAAPGGAPAAVQREKSTFLVPR